MDGSHTTSVPVAGVIKRRRFTAAEVQALIEIGVLKDGEKVELLRGELVEMSPQGPLHWDVTSSLLDWLRDHLPASLGMASQGPLRLGEHDEPEPEFFIYPRNLRVNEVRGPDTVLVIEVAKTSLRIDLKVKAPIYAEYSVKEYWVVDVKKQRTLVHRLGDDGLYGKPVEVAFDAPLKAPGGKRLVIANLAPKA